MRRVLDSWDTYFLSIADVVKQKSKDPSSKIGAVLVGLDRQIIATGFNGHPRGIDESLPERWERPTKYEYVVHAEENCIYNAARTGVSTKGSTLYLIGFGPPVVPCIHCTKAIIQAGIVRIVGQAYKEAPENWKHDLDFSVQLLKEVGIECVES